MHAFTFDIYVNPVHFKAVSESQCRIAKLEKASKAAIEDWYTREKSQLESTYKEQLKTAKKKSKTEENKVVSAHKKELAHLNVLYNQEKKHPWKIRVIMANQ